MSFLISLAAENAGWIIGILAVLGTFFGYGWKQKRAGKREAIEEMEAETDRQVAKGEDIARRVEGLSDDEVNEGLEKWHRD